MSIRSHMVLIALPDLQRYYLDYLKQDSTHKKSLSSCYALPDLLLFLLLFFFRFFRFLFRLRAGFFAGAFSVPLNFTSTSLDSEGASIFDSRSFICSPQFRSRSESAVDMKSNLESLYCSRKLPQNVKWE